MVDVIAILTKLESLGYVRPTKIIGDWHQLYCPFHSGGNEKRASAGVLIRPQHRNGVNYPEGMFHCFTCGAAYRLPDFIAKLLKLHNVTQTSLEWLGQNVEGFVKPEDYERVIPLELSEALVNKFAIQHTQELSGISQQTYVSEEELASYRYTVEYMYERKLTDKIINDYDVGVDMNFTLPGKKKVIPCITFPVRDINGRTLFIARRSIEGKLYNYPEEVIKPLYGIDMLPKDCKSVIVCESIINALTAVRYGYNAVALLGTGNDYQIKQLRTLGIKDIVLCMDGDSAGHKASGRLKRNLRDVAIVWTIHMPDGKDLNDCSEEEFNQLYNERD